MQEAITKQTQIPTSISNRSFLLLWMAQFCSLLGGVITALALGVWAFERSGETTDLALLHIASTTPYILGLPFAGIIADRMPRKYMIILGDAGAVLGTLLLLVLTQQPDICIGILLAIVGFQSLCGSLQYTALQSLIPDVVHHERLPAANSMIQMAGGLVMIVGPPLGAALYSSIGLSAVLCIDIISALSAIACVSAIASPTKEKATTQTQPQNPLQAARDGFRFIRGHAILLGLCGFSFVVQAFVGMATGLFQPLILLLADRWMLTVLLISYGLGIATSMAVPRLLGVYYQARSVILGSAALTACSLIGVGFTSSVTFLMMLVFIFGCTTVSGNAATMTFIQNLVPLVMDSVAVFVFVLLLFLSWARRSRKRKRSH